MNGFIVHQDLFILSKVKDLLWNVIYNLIDSFKPQGNGFFLQCQDMDMKIVSHIPVSEEIEWTNETIYNRILIKSQYVISNLELFWA